MRRLQKGQTRNCRRVILQMPLNSRRLAGSFGSGKPNCILADPMPTRDELLDLFRKSGALLEGHFRLSSGLHSTGYLQCALVLQNPAAAEQLARAVADPVRS